MRVIHYYIGVPKKCRLTIEVVFIVVTPQVQCKPVAELDSASGNSTCNKRKIRGAFRPEYLGVTNRVSYHACAEYTGANLL